MWKPVETAERDLRTPCELKLLKRLSRKDYLLLRNRVSEDPPAEQQSTVPVVPKTKSPRGQIWGKYGARTSDVRKGKERCYCGCDVDISLVLSGQIR
jgi:hypothetical protein